MGIQLKEVDLDEIPATPDVDDLEATLSHPAVVKASKILSDHAEAWGFPAAYKQEQNGRLIHNLIPQKKYETDQISGSSKKELELHTESAFHPYKPSHLHLLCLRGDENAATTYANIEDILPQLSQAEMEILQQPLFLTGVDQSFKLNNEPSSDQMIYPLRKKAENWEMCYDGELTTGINLFASEALEAMRKAIKNVTKEITLKKGQLLIIDNTTTIHGRKPFQARYDGTDRWLQRATTIQTKPPRAQYQNKTIITEFKPKISW